MLKTRSQTLALALLLVATQWAAASTYDFSYAIPASNTKVVGSFDGTTAGDFVVGISNIQASFEGRALAGPLYAYGYNGSGWLSVNPVVSFTRAKNEFIFVNCPHFACAGDPTGSAYNYFVLRSSGANLAAFYFASTGFAMSDSSQSSVWTLTDRAAPVPEPAAFALLASGLLAVAARKRLGGQHPPQ